MIFEREKYNYRVSRSIPKEKWAELKFGTVCFRTDTLTWIIWGDGSAEDGEFIDRCVCLLSVNVDSSG